MTPAESDFDGVRAAWRTLRRLVAIILKMSIMMLVVMLMNLAEWMNARLK